MSDILYITDLDGTLLREDARLSDYSCQTINRLIAGGVAFSVATARTLHSAMDVIEPLNIRLPIALMNGVLIYDLQQQKYIQVNKMPPDEVTLVIDLLSRLDMSAFMYALDGNAMKVFYNSKYLDETHDPEYHQERTEWGGRKFIRHDNFHNARKEQSIIYFTMYGDLETMRVMYNQVRKLPQLGHTFCEDIYDGRYFLEIFSAGASKATGSAFVKDWCGAREVVAFGDNQNDLEMLRWADRCYVPEGGIRAAKELATSVIGPCGKDSVARFILEDIKSEEIRVDAR